LPPGSSQAEQTATRRAIASLRKAHLIDLAEETRRVSAAADPKLLRRLKRKYTVLRYMSRTELGEAVAKVYAPEPARPGARIRWEAGRLHRVRERALEKCPLRHKT